MKRTLVFTSRAAIGSLLCLFPASALPAVGNITGQNGTAIGKGLREIGDRHHRYSHRHHNYRRHFGYSRGIYGYPYGSWGSVPFGYHFGGHHHHH